MATGDKYTNVYSKKFLSWQEFSTYIIAYLKNLIKDGIASFVTGGLSSGFFSAVTLGSDAVDEIDVGAFKGADKESNIIEQASPRSGYEDDVPFENTTAIDYHVGVHHFEVPDEAEIAARTGEAEYRYFREDIGEVAHPDGVTDNGNGTITLVVNSVTEARDNTNRYVYVWLVDPLSAVDWIEEKQIVWNSGASENRITTMAKLGQDTISTDVNDYWVALRGVSVKRDTDIRTDKSYIYVGKATGNSGGIPGFSTTDQKLLESIYNFEQEVIDARDTKTSLQDRLEGEAEYNIIIDSADKGDYITLAAYIPSAAAGDRVLVNVDEEITGATMVIPANILLKLEKGKKFWCDEDRSVLQLSDGVVTEGDLLLELSHTGTVPTAVSFNGNDNNHCNIIIKNTTTGTITNAFKLETGKDGNKIRGELLNPSGTVTNVFANNAEGDNDFIVRISGGVTINSYGADGNSHTVKILPSDFTTADSANPEQIASDGTDVTVAGSTTGIVATVSIPIGYKATAVRVYALSSLLVSVVENAIDDNSAATKGGGDTTAEIDITDVTASGVNYLSITLEDVNSVVIYGGYVTIEPI